MTDIVFSVRLWPSVIVLASHASRGYFAAIVDRTMVTSGQLPMRLAICLLILLILISQCFEIDFILGAFVAGAVVRAALPEYELKATAVSQNRLA
jgi:Kef-type K+ transport system membrane component KefB